MMGDAWPHKISGWAVFIALIYKDVRSLPRITLHYKLYFWCNNYDPKRLRRLGGH